MQEWRVIDTGYQDGLMNMAVDEAMLLEHAVGRTLPTIRFYGWKPACMTIGYFQDLEKEIDVTGCTEEGVDYVRRLTGGRAILHDDELTYSLVAKVKNPKVSGSILESYLKISQGILKGLLNLGVPAQIVSHVRKGQKGSAACFDSPSWYEIVVEGRKLAGSAQTRKQDIILQHGSIPFSLNAAQLFRMLVLPSEAVRERLKRNFLNQACSINEILKRKVSYQEAVSAFTGGFEEGLGIRLIPGELTGREWELALELKENKYASETWNYSKS